MMKWSTTWFGVVLCLCALPATRVQSQTVATDASPGEFPYVVNLNLLDQTYPYTAPGLVVSGRYLLTAYEAYVDGDVTKMQIIDQQGKVRAPFQINQIYMGTFVYIKFCDKFGRTKFPMAASSFNDLSANVSATLIFFNGSSHVLKKVSATALDSETCKSLVSGNTDRVCMKKDDTTGFCKMFLDSEANPTYNWFPVLAINGQVHGLNIKFSCTNTGDMSDKWAFQNIDTYRELILKDIPIVDIK